MIESATIAIDCGAGGDFVLPVARAALVVVDMQRDFLDPQGAFGQSGLDVAPLRAIVPTVEGLLAAARRAGLAIVHTREGHRPDLSDLTDAKRWRSAQCGCEVGAEGPLGRFLVRGEPGHALVDTLAPRDDEIVIDKPGFGAFHETALQAALTDRDIDHLLIAGVTTECCVQSTLREAVDHGHYCLTVTNACAAFDHEQHTAALRLVENDTEAHLFGWAADSAAVVAALERA